MLNGCFHTEKAPIAPEDVMRAEKEKKRADKLVKKVVGLPLPRVVSYIILIIGVCITFLSSSIRT